MKYNSWLIWSISSKCSLNCHYCIGNKKSKRSEEIDIDQSIQTLKSLPKNLLVTITSNGEPFCHKQFIQLTENLSLYFDWALHTNLVSGDITDWLRRIDTSRIVQIIASFHHEELIRCNLLDTFFENYQQLMAHKLPVLVKPIAIPDNPKRNNHVISLLEKHNCNYQFDFFIDQDGNKKYPQSYTSEELSQYRLSSEEHEAFNSLNKACNAGFNSIYAVDNSVYICHHHKNQIGTMKTGVNLCSSYIECRKNHCSCPIYFYSNNLLNMPKNVLAKKQTLRMRLASCLNKVLTKCYFAR